MLANVFDITSCFRLSLPWGGRLISVIHIRSMEKISTHALRGEGDRLLPTRLMFLPRFQSTPSVGRATISCVAVACISVFQSTPSVGRATPAAAAAATTRRLFQSTPSVGRATKKTMKNSTFGSFQSTPSVGRATGLAKARGKSDGISIHALRGEGDGLAIGLTR